MFVLNNFLTFVKILYMKKFFYSLPVSLILNILMAYLTWNYWSLPMIIISAFFIVIYSERASEYRKLKRQNKI